MTEHGRAPIGASVGAFEPWITAENADVAMREAARNARRRHGPPEREAALETRPGVLAAEVSNAIFWDLAVPRDRVRAHCEGGWVTLTGAVERPYQRSAAEADALRVRGVRGVTNAIIVTAPAA
jgi:osmotically-inducible protein OsmY